MNLKFGHRSSGKYFFEIIIFAMPKMQKKADPLSYLTSYL